MDVGMKGGDSGEDWEGWTVEPGVMRTGAADGKGKEKSEGIGWKVIAKGSTETGKSTLPNPVGS